MTVTKKRLVRFTATFESERDIAWLKTQIMNVLGEDADVQIKVAGTGYAGEHLGPPGET